MERTAVMAKQVGGDHYNKHMGLQPWDIIDEYGLNYYEGNVLKYLLREKSDRIEDLRKLIHYAEKELENISPVDDLGNEEDTVIDIEEMLKGTTYEFAGYEDGFIFIRHKTGIEKVFTNLHEFKLWRRNYGS